MKSTESQDFSIALGGPLYQLLIKTRMLRPPLELLVRRMIFFGALTWVPLLVLSIVDNNVIGSNVALPFLNDFDVHIRFLISLPLMIFAELYAHKMLVRYVTHFRNCGVVSEDDQPKFDHAVSSAMKLRNSYVIEIALLLFVFLAGRYVFRASSMVDKSTWYYMSSMTGNHLSKAGWWYAVISLPLFQFMILRWYFRFFVWTRFLWHISRLELRLMPTHPDNAGGIGFLENTTLAFIPLMLAHGFQVAGVLANRIFHEGKSLLIYKIDIATIVLLLIGIVLGPLLVFAARLIELRRKSLGVYGALSYKYVSAFDRKWIGDPLGNKEDLLGTPDLQSLADLANSYSVIKAIRPVPFSKRSVVRVALIVLAPISPLVLTLIPLEKLIERAFRLIF